MDFLWVGAGGFLGANLRFLLNTWIAGFGHTFPLGTLLINVSGSLAIGAALTLFGGRLINDPAMRLFAVVGFLGGYTTFSSYTAEALGLAMDGEWLKAAGYILGNNVLGLLAVALGATFGRAVHA